MSAIQWRSMTVKLVQTPCGHMRSNITCTKYRLLCWRQRNQNTSRSEAARNASPPWLIKKTKPSLRIISTLDRLLVSRRGKRDGSCRNFSKGKSNSATTILLTPEESREGSLSPQMYMRARINAGKREQLSRRKASFGRILPCLNVACRRKKRRTHQRLPLEAHERHQKNSNSEKQHPYKSNN